MINDEHAPILSNSINRIIFIDKEEFILSYKHNKIDNFSDDEINIGKFYLTKKKTNKQGELIQYFTDEKILVKNTINQNVLKNDKLLIKKIVYMLEGRLNENEIMKIDEGNLFKIVFRMKNGVNLIIFNCVLSVKILQDYSEILNTTMRYFKNKIKLNEDIDIKINEIDKMNDYVAKRYSNLSREIENKENDYLTNICYLLNEKKNIILNLRKDLEGMEDLPLIKQGQDNIINSNLLNQNKIQDDELNQSQTLSLTDLI